MKETNDSFDDPLVPAFDVAKQPHTADGQLRAAVFTQTVGLLRGRRRLKRCALVAGLVGCYLAGVTTMSLLQGSRGQGQPTVQGPTVAGGSQHAAPRVKHVSTHPQKQTQQVAAKKPTGFESWRRIGDHYLRESGDISLALAGYSEAINLASAEERRISPGQDNWLLMALKQDAQSKEKRHVSHQN
jgi:hypothetical protein